MRIHGSATGSSLSSASQRCSTVAPYSRLVAILKRSAAGSSPKAAPSGTYEVRVDATSLCGQVTARWHAYAITSSGEVLGEAYGQATDIDTQGSHGPATGTLAFTFMVP